MLYGLLACILLQNLKTHTHTVSIYIWITHARSQLHSCSISFKLISVMFPLFMLDVSVSQFHVCATIGLRNVKLSENR